MSTNTGILDLFSHRPTAEQGEPWVNFKPLVERGSCPLSIAAQLLEVVNGRDSLDWKDLPATEITKRVTTKVQAGSIVLFHNAAKHTPEALPTILETLLQQGYTFVPISQIILPQPYTIDHAGRQHKE